MSNLERWKKAVIHLEGAADSMTAAESQRLFKESSAGNISNEEYMELRKQGMRDKRFRGTAVYIQDGNKFYLVTARHVLHDELKAKRVVDEAETSVRKFHNEEDHAQRVKEENERASNSIFSLIFRISTFDEFIGEMGAPSQFLMNLDAGHQSNYPYTFSNNLIDIGVIALHAANGGMAFKLNLDRAGYEPISIEDVSDGPKAEGDEIFTVGYPGATSTVGDIPSEYDNYNWSSRAVSLPVFSFGKVAMLHEKLDFFWGDISIYQGNSGGPIVSGDKLVGIVSAGATIPVLGLPSDIKGRTMIPFAYLIKAKFVKKIIEEQEERHSSFWKFVYDTASLTPPKASE